MVLGWVNDMDDETKMTLVVCLAICLVVLIINASLRVDDWLVLQKFKNLEGKSLEYELCMNSSHQSNKVLCLDIVKGGE